MAILFTTPYLLAISPLVCLAIPQPDNLYRSTKGIPLLQARDVAGPICTDVQSPIPADVQTILDGLRSDAQGSVHVPNGGCIFYEAGTCVGYVCVPDCGYELEWDKGSVAYWMERVEDGCFSNMVAGYVRDGAGGGWTVEISYAGTQDELPPYLEAC